MVDGSILTASSLARGINTPGTAGVRDSQFQIQYTDRCIDQRSGNQTQRNFLSTRDLRTASTTILSQPPSAMIASCNRIVRSSSDVTMATHWDGSCICSLLHMPRA